MKKTFFISILSLFFASCANEFVEEHVELSKSDADKKELVQNYKRSMEEVRDIAINFFQSSTDLRSAELQITDVDVFRLKGGDTRSSEIARTWNDETAIDTLMYAINFADKASVVVTADKRMPPVIAAFDKQNFYFKDLHKKENEPTAFLLGMIANEVLTNIENDGMMWYLPNPEWNDSIAQDENSGLWRLSMSIHPRLKTSWHQSSPFNGATPLEKGRHTLVGCVAVAIGQALTIVKPQIVDEEAKQLGINWDKMEDIRNNVDMNKDPIMSKKVAEYLYFIGKKGEMKYGLKGSLANTQKALFLNSKLFNYKYREVGTADEIRKVLSKDSCAIIMRGNMSNGGAGHAFVVDGYKNYTYKPFEDKTNLAYVGVSAYTIYHINFGWGDHVDGNTGYFLGNYTDRWAKFDPNKVKYPEDIEFGYTEQDIFWRRGENYKFNEGNRWFVLYNKNYPS